MQADNVHPISAGSGKSWRCVLVGDESLLVECGRLLEQRGHDIVAVVSARPEIAAWAGERAAQLLPDAASLLTADLGGVDYLFSITNLAVLPVAALELATRAAINFHDGPLPEYAGLNTPSWALLDGATTYGVTWHLMTRDVDAGAVLAQQRFAVAADETSLSLNRKCFVAGIETFAALIETLATGATATPGTVPLRICRRRDRPAAAGAIRWDEPAERIDRLVRALDFGGYANPLGSARAVCAGQHLLVMAVLPLERASTLPPGTIVTVDPAAIVVATATYDVALTRLATMAGERLDPAAATTRFRLRAGSRFDLLDAAAAAALTTLNAAIAVHDPFWSRRLAEQVPLGLPHLGRYDASDLAHIDQPLAASADPARSDTVVVAIAAYLARVADADVFDLGFATPVMAAQTDGLDGWFAAQVPLRVACDFAAGFDAFHDAVTADIAEAHRRIGFAADLPARTPGVRASVLPVAVVVVDRIDDARPLDGADLTLAVRSDGALCRWIHDPRRLAAGDVAAMQRQFATLLAAVDRDAAAGTVTAVADLPLIDGAVAADATAGAWRDDACIHDLIAEQTVRTPDARAVTCDGRSLTYAELDRAATRWARRLRAMGVRRDTLVGLCVERSVEMVVGVLAIHKAGGAYVPLDPDYPADRLRHMIDDSGVGVIVTQSRLAGQLPPHRADLVCLDAPTLADTADEPGDGGATPDSLAYVIYTSGSTGKPKGVMVEHRNVVNFFAGIDARVPAPGVWLAVTSLSFDISVLELLWTLTRGFEVVLYRGGDRRAAEAIDAHASRPLDFSLFYFSGDAAANAADKYHLLLEGARFGDREGFAAVWTPERHFHAFGGLYPNPAVTSAAIAAVTERIEIRAGSVVLPLHHPVRVAEEWSVVDNLSRGRVSISFAAGWQPNDFVLAPGAFADNKAVMLRDIDVVRKLWRGESVAFPGPLGHDVPVAILPRPVQPELPVWLTSAGNVETFVAAGKLGARVLTHLLGQTVEELTAKLDAYRAAWRAAGHAGEGRVALMLHSFVGDDAEQVREIVRQPLIDYLRSSASLIKQYAWSFPAFKRRPGMEQSGDLALDGLDDDEMAALLDHAFERYYATSGLFGTPEQCEAMVARVKAAGVDEIACLIDFGIDAATVLAHLPQLNAVRRRALPRVAATGDDMPTLIERHGVTHLQCTPSLASLLLADERGGPALRTVGTMMVGGEAFPPTLAAALKRHVGGSVMNMYGPTETTIWSTTETVDAVDGGIPLGAPLLNQDVHVLDRRGRPLPDGVPGELVIGGNGVTRGYLGRAELTAERFVAHPTRAGERAYRTGDLVRRRDGRLEFLGRLDNQVKIRGHRIELGEIEAELAACAEVREAAVAVREDTPGDIRLIAYVVAMPGAAVGETLRDRLRQRLPEAMVPAQIVTLAAMPRTPNGKLDRKALPAPAATAVAAPDAAFLAPAAGIEEAIAAIWRDVLRLPSVGANDNFFDIGGHSLLAVQLHRQLREAFGPSLSITDIFRYPTIATLKARLDAGGADTAAVESGQNRAQDRRAAMGRRRGAATMMTSSERV